MSLGFADTLLPGFGAAERKTDLAALRLFIRQAENGADVKKNCFLPFEGKEIDAVLGGGLPLGRLHEITSEGLNKETGGVSAGFAAAILGRISKSQNGMVLWAFTRDDLYAPGLARFGLHPDQLVLVRGRKDDEVLSVLEEALRTGSFAGVLGEIESIGLTAIRRLQLACEKYGTTGFVLRRWAYGPKLKSSQNAPSVTTRWQIAACPSQSDEPGYAQALGPERWRIELTQRQGLGGSWIVEASNAAGHVRVVTELADHQAETSRPHPIHRFRQA